MKDLQEDFEMGVVTEMHYILGRGTWTPQSAMAGAAPARKYSTTRG